jgi:beta-phosphoglucomutase
LKPQAAFIFDMDGVIVDSNPAHKVALKQFCKKYGKDLGEDELREKIYGRRNQDWLVSVFGPLDPKTLQAYADEKEALFRQIYDRDIRPLDGLPEFLEAVRNEQIPRAIATSAPRSNVDFTLAKTGLGPFFETILDDKFVTHGKPHPEVYLKAAGALSFAPGHCVVFEDSLAGVEAGKNAGCKVVGIATTHSADELDRADIILENFTGVKPRELILKLF